jgi:hypothetical protein
LNVIIGEGWRVTVLKEETVIPLGIGLGFGFVVLEGEEAVTMATGCGMRRMRRRILWDREGSVWVSCSAELLCSLERLEEGVDEKGRCRYIDVLSV